MPHVAVSPGERQVWLPAAIPPFRRARLTGAPAGLIVDFVLDALRFLSLPLPLAEAVALGLVLTPRTAGAAEFTAGKAVGQITANGLAELSGMAASRRNPGVLWVQNDRDRDKLYAVSTNGQLLATWSLDRTVSDMEDLALGPGPNPQLEYLYCGDIGDNASTRSDIRVFRTPEPAVYSYLAADPPSPKFAAVERMTLRYPDGSHNAEALFVDPVTGDLFIVTKQPGRARVYRAARTLLQDAAAITLAFETEIPFDIVSAADMSADGSEILIRQEEFARLWRRGSGQSVAQALTGQPIEVPVIGTPIEPNGEAVALTGDRRGYFTISEGSRPVIYYFARTNGLPPLSEEPLVAPATEWRFQDHGGDAGTAWRTPDFVDLAWPRGFAQFGYGDRDQQTLLSYGPDEERKHITTYFRRSFVVRNPSALRSLKLGLVYDDGVTVYLNGAEILRRNLPADAHAATPAIESGSAGENLWQFFTLTNSLVPGTNSIAVEVHRHSPSEGDLSFDLQLLGTTVASELKFSRPPERTAANGWRLEYEGGGSGQVFLESSASLTSWTTVASAPYDAASGTFTLPEDNTAARFYRLRY